MFGEKNESIQKIEGIIGWWVRCWRKKKLNLSSKQTNSTQTDHASYVSNLLGQVSEQQMFRNICIYQLHTSPIDVACN